MVTRLLSWARSASELCYLSSDFGGARPSSPSSPEKDSNRKSYKSQVPQPLPLVVRFCVADESCHTLSANKKMNSSIESTSSSIETKTADQHDEFDVEKGKEEPTPDKEVYPAFRVVLPTILCLYLAVFLTALVSPGTERLRSAH